MLELGTLTVSPFRRGVAGHDAAGETWTPVGADLDALMLAEFLDAVRTDRKPQPDAAVGIRTLEIVSAARTSAASSGPPVHLA